MADTWLRFAGHVALGSASNIYLLSHAASTFKKIRTAFHNGTLQVGQNVWYSNAQGDISKWEVRWIRRVTAEYLNATAGDWALNDSPTPIMTLQTCDGAQSQLRIIVRLISAD
ncbi:MAG: sortase [Candidatus Limnocylindrales bacterium]